MLASRVRGQSTLGFDGMFEEHKSSRGFTQLHKVLLNIDSSYGSMADYLSSVAPGELIRVIDTPDVLGRTPLAWAVEYGLLTAVELLLRYGANSNQLRSTKDGGYSPLIHLAIAGPYSAWMDTDIVETVRLLFQAGAGPNGTDHEGWTPLHIAASWGLFNVTDMLQRCSQSFLDWQAWTLTGESILDVCDNLDYKSRYWGMVLGPTRLM
jgi:ankyrin repeat protein